MSIAVVSIDEKGERTVYPSMTEAAAEIGANVSQISIAVNFKKVCHGLMWEREDQKCTD